MPLHQPRSRRVASRRGALVLALNPSVDAEWRVGEVRWEEKNLVETERRWAGGKGINVARWLRFLNRRVNLVLPLGGQPGKELARCLRDEKLPATIIPLQQPTRVNIIVTTNNQGQLRFNPAGPKVSRSEWSKIVSTIERNLRGSDLLVLSGSLPRGLPMNAYAQLIRLAHRGRVKTLLDCDGAALVSAVKAKPFLVKPNEAELAEWWGKPLRAETDVVRAAAQLSGVTGGWIFVSRGARRGLLLHREFGVALWAQPPQTTPRNTVGAGDALLAGVARQIQLGAGPEDWLRHGIAAGTAATRSPAGCLPA